MASLITCPHCGIRPKEEFSIRGDAGPMRPAVGAAPEAWHAYVNLRDNVRGVMREHWQHTGGCRRWLVVERDTFSHDVLVVSDASKTPVQAQAAAKPAASKAAAGKAAAKPVEAAARPTATRTTKGKTKSMKDTGQ
ncbi:heterotetrameric sarcosine oxidase delta subunit [Hoeflea marina]|uniref:Heterotetrameric sarcosine oxidase delta subunit n=1 Tax=Hoeflea marina TaxID=274592 RepID=A0A317PCB3_9HYPH|nr:heterotetrameric sarcosine oxidase delta subunit [Hoeflea marina]